MLNAPDVWTGRATRTGRDAGGFTRTFLAREGDTPQAIAQRFGALSRPGWAGELSAANPILNELGHIHSGLKLTVPDPWGPEMDADASGIDDSDVGHTVYVAEDTTLRAAPQDEAPAIATLAMGVPLALAAFSPDRTWAACQVLGRSAKGSIRAACLTPHAMGSRDDAPSGDPLETGTVAGALATPSPVAPPGALVCGATVDPGTIPRMQCVLAACKQTHPEAGWPEGFGEGYPLSPDTLGVMTPRTQQALAAFQRWNNGLPGAPKLRDDGMLDPETIGALDSWCAQALGGMTCRPPVRVMPGPEAGCGDAGAVDDRQNITQYVYALKAGDGMWAVAKAFGAEKRPHWFGELRDANPHKKIHKDPVSGKQLNWAQSMPGETVNVPDAWDPGKSPNARPAPGLTPTPAANLGLKTFPPVPVQPVAPPAAAPVAAADAAAKAVTAAAASVSKAAQKGDAPAAANALGAAVKAGRDAVDAVKQAAANAPAGDAQKAAAAAARTLNKAVEAAVQASPKAPAAQAKAAAVLTNAARVAANTVAPLGGASAPPAVTVKVDPHAGVFADSKPPPPVSPGAPPPPDVITAVNALPARIADKGPPGAPGLPPGAPHRSAPAPAPEESSDSLLPAVVIGGLTVVSGLAKAALGAIGL